MKHLFETVRTRLGLVRQARAAPTTQRSFQCECGRPVFFRNSRCVTCHRPLAYEPDSSQMLWQDESQPVPTWLLPGHVAATGDASQRLCRCANFDSPAGCNWLVPLAEDESTPAQPLCRSCRLNRVIPDLSIAENGVWWARFELAKRRLVSSLIGLGLPVRSRISEDPERGLAFDLLRAVPGGPKVMTGHDDGIITLNIEEADDARRETLRQALHEPYRTPLGHLRHEVGHYYWQILVDGSDWLEPYRQLFGDERADYGEALKRHYNEGAPADWALRHVSAYASTHPWEDWAETWAHYLHMVDTLDTALSFGLDPESMETQYEQFTPQALFRPDDAEAADFLSFMNAWIGLTGVLNELSRSMGQQDYYPFVLPVAAVAKLQFVHLLVQSCGAPPGSPDPQAVPQSALSPTPVSAQA